MHEAMVDLAGSTATKRNRARQILKTPEKNVSLNSSYLNIELYVKYDDAVGVIWKKISYLCADNTWLLCWD